MAALTNNVVVARELMKRGAAAGLRDRRGRTPLYMAAEIGRAAVLDVMTDPRGDDSRAADIRILLSIPAHDGTMPIHAAVQGDFADVVAVLLMRAQPNYALSPELSSGLTALHMAVRNGNSSLALRTPAGID